MKSRAILLVPVIAFTADYRVNLPLYYQLTSRPQTVRLSKHTHLPVRVCVEILEHEAPWYGTCTITFHAQYLLDVITVLW